MSNIITAKLPIHIRGTINELVVYLPGGMQQSGRLYGPAGGWSDPRDLEFIKRLNAKGYGVYALGYDVLSSYDAALGFYKPYNWIKKNVYDFTVANKYDSVHLVGFSGGGALASSQVLYYPDPLVKDMVLIGAPVNNNPKYVNMNAAFYSDQIVVPTYLIYGSSDQYRTGADTWVIKSPNTKWNQYVGGHGYEVAFDQVVDWVEEFIGAPQTTRKIIINVTVAGVKVPITLNENEARSYTIDVVGTIQG
jgi:hypothetical protein